VGRGPRLRRLGAQCFFIAVVGLQLAFVVRAGWRGCVEGGRQLRRHPGRGAGALFGRTEGIQLAGLFADRQE